MHGFRLFFVLAALATIIAPQTGFANAMIPQKPEQITLSFAPVAKSASAAVVNITTRKVVRQRVLSPFMDDPLFQQFFGGGASGGVLRKRMESSLGSGVVVRADGLIVTSNHVIAGADEITVVLPDKREFEAKLMTADERSDLAVLKIETKGEALPYLTLKDSDTVEVGDLVLAIGNPFGVGQTVTSGIISAPVRAASDSQDGTTYIQTDAAINPGNSGGALVAMDGRLVGINAAIYSKSGGYMGIGFAVPSNMVRAVVSAVEAGKKTVAHAWTGIEGQDVTSELAASLGLSKPGGVLVKKIQEASPAKAAGLKIGDVIESVNGKSVDDNAALRYRIATLPLGGEVRFGLLRKGTQTEVSFKLAPAPENMPRNETKVTGRNPLGGATLANLSPALIEENQWSGEAEGVVILRLDENGAAAQLGLQPGDIVREINGQKIATVKEATEALRETTARGWRMLLERNGEKIRLMIGR